MRSAQSQLDSHRTRLDDLDELADIMSEMLDRQYAVEVECNEQISQLSTRVAEMEGLKERYTSYQYSYSKLVVELDRRRTYQKTTQKIVEGMREKLRLMVDGKVLNYVYPGDILIASRGKTTDVGLPVYLRGKYPRRPMFIC